MRIYAIRGRTGPWPPDNLGPYGMSPTNPCPRGLDTEPRDRDFPDCPTGSPSDGRLGAGINPLIRCEVIGCGGGFTLLEMLIVLVIAAILMATLIPNFAPAIARAQLYSATRDIASALRHTRGLAMVTKRDALFELNIEHHSYRVTGRPKAYPLPPEVELSLYTTATETMDEGTGRIRFFPDGSATGGRVTLTANKQKKVVDVNWLTGEVRMGEDDGDQ